MRAKLKRTLQIAILCILWGVVICGVLFLVFIVG